MIQHVRSAIWVFAVAVVLNTTSAEPVIFFGEDLDPGNILPPNGNADTARSNFLSAVAGVGVEDMEGFAARSTAPFTLQFIGSSGPVTGSLTASGTDPLDAVWDAPFDGRFAISGTQFWQTSNAFEISFSTPVSAFGFFATDGGDGPAQLTLRLTLSDGATTDVLVPHFVGGDANGAVLFFGFTDSVNSYSSISFLNSDPGHDFYGFDDWTVGTPAPKLVTIDIDPRSDTNRIRPDSRGGIWVAVLSDIGAETTFDPVGQIDIPTVRFGPGGAQAIRHQVQDVNGDGLGDLILGFLIRSTGIQCGDTEATLTGETFAGETISGSDSIRTVGCR